MKKGSARRETSAVSGMRGNDRTQKPDHNAATLSEPSLSRGRSVSRKRSIRGISNHGSIFRQPCRYFLKGTCTRSPCEYWNAVGVSLLQNRNGCKAGDECLFPHHKVDEQSNKKGEERLLFTKKRRKRRQECCSYCEHCTTTGLRLERLGCVGFSKTKQSRETRCKKSWDRFKENDSLSLRHVKQISGKRKDHRWEKEMLKSSSSKSLRYEI